ncbi:MAG: thioredoxin family protein, partial [Verrucomicrobiota bacterium]
MKYARVILLTIACLTGPVFGASDSQAPETTLDLNSALVLARAESRQVLAYFRSSTCGLCLSFEREVLTSQKVREALNGVYFAQVDSESEQSNFAIYGVRVTPAFYIIGADGEARSLSLGYQQETEFLKLIDQVRSAQGSSSVTDQVVLPATISEEALAENLLQLSDSVQGQSVRKAIAEIEPRPLGLMVKLLEHPVLAVRLGALETLESWSGNSYGFDPWAPGSTENQDALAKWKLWLDDGAIEEGQNAPELSFDDAIRYINDLQGGDDQAARRARLKLEQGGKRVAAMVDRFRERNPDLPLDADARLRELHYILLLKQTSIPAPENLAHRLVFGNLDLRLSGVRALGGAKSVGRRLLEDFLKDPEPLVRETAAEVLLTQFSLQGADPVLDMLEREKDENIKYIILRNLSAVKTDRAKEVLFSYLDHDNEDLVIVSLESLATLKANDTLNSGIPQCLKDPRWRVRVAGLKAAQKVRYQKHKEILDMFDDEDGFVRITAVQTVGSLKPSGSDSVLRKAFERDELKAPVIAAYMAMNQQPPSEILDSIPALDKETIFSILGAVDYADETIFPLLKLLIYHEDSDIAAAALNIFCQREVRDQEVLSLLAEVMKSGDEARINALLLRFRLSDELSQVYRIREVSSNSKGSENGLLDRFLDTFARAEASGTKSSQINPLQTMRDAAADLLEDDGPMQMSAALFLLEIGSGSSVDLLDKRLEQLGPDERNNLVRALRRANPSQARLFLKRLLSDPDSSVRSNAVESIYRDHNNPEIMSYLFSEISRRDSPLQPQELVHYNFDNAMKNLTSPEVRKALAAMLEPATSDHVKAYALMAMHYSWANDYLSVVEPHTRSDSPWVRRAAWFAIAKNAPKALEQRYELLTADPSPHVRVVLPASFISDSYTWNAHIDQRSFFRDYIYDYQHNQSAFNLGWAQSVIVSMTEDESVEVALTAYQAILDNRVPFEMQRFADFISLLPDKKQAAEILYDYFEENIESLPE